MVQCKYERKGTQCLRKQQVLVSLSLSFGPCLVAHLFATRQIGYILPTLLGRHDAKHDTFREWVQTVHKL